MGLLIIYRLELNSLVFLGLSCLSGWKTFAILERRIGDGLVEYLVSGGHRVFGRGTNHLFDRGYYDNYCNNALESLFQSTERPVQEAEMSFFIDFTADSALPLLCG